MKPTTALELAAFGQCPSQARASGDPDEDGHLGRRGPRLAGERRRPNLEWLSGRLGRPSRRSRQAHAREGKGIWLWRAIRRARRRRRRLTDPDGYRIELVQWPPGHLDGITAADFQW